ncbi:DUF3179 domain-containing protein [Patescibacteria group bacterium]|nr:DUF3179 domain-containing protein [Patescibacteria group bacterium]MBU1673888.1 DUF3179 domain-containing protein [Patescibacteria group bacterium]MBU1963439.1 DUF3179 domain-containing protein [Patescibacteria group bacterium]
MQRKYSKLIAEIIFILVLVGLFAWWLYRERTSLDLPIGGETVILENEHSERPIMETDGTKHNIPLEEIEGGGPGKDGIPAIDDPKFISAEEASEWLEDEDPGISVTKDGITRFYPYKILVWHEIVNDTINDRRVLVTYCPLCFSGVVFDPIVQGERVEFGVSGKLWKSNLVMYDRLTDSLWSQLLGEAVVGEETGSVLPVIPLDQMQFGRWKENFPTGQVLSKDTGAFRTYGVDPYGSYYDSSSIYFDVGNEDDRLFEKEVVFGIVVNDQAKAYLPEAVAQMGSFEDEIAGQKVEVEYLENMDIIRFYKIGENGTKEQVNPVPNFWFSWVAVHPDTKLYN